MTRIVVAREGEVFNNCLIESYALWCEDEQLPVDWNGDATRVIGTASKMKRDEQTGEISMEVEMSPMFAIDLKDGIEGFVYVSPFESEEHPVVEGAISKVISGRVRRVSLQNSMPPANPKSLGE